MNAEEFARQFNQLFREVYRLAARRVANNREILSVETNALLLHLAQTGPATLSELTQHFDRALSTLSVKIAELETQGLLARQRDPTDARRALIWLTPAGRQAMLEALEVLDSARIAAAANTLNGQQHQQLLESLRVLIHALPPVNSDPGDKSHDSQL